MTNPDVTAAASDAVRAALLEALKTVQAELTRYRDGLPLKHGTFEELKYQVVDPAIGKGQFSNHVLATVAADDAVEITEEWLQSLGFGMHSGTLPHPWCIYTTECMQLQYMAHENRWAFKLHNIPSPTTRGQLRQLCRALNIALQPSGQDYPSRSIQRREAAMRGEEPPEFKPGTNEVIEPSGQEQGK